MLLQLRYRHDKEIEGQSRSALRKIYEKDDVPSKCLILVVADMKKLENGSGIFLELTDGWYSIGNIPQIIYIIYIVLLFNVWKQSKTASLQILFKMQWLCNHFKSL